MIKLQLLERKLGIEKKMFDQNKCLIMKIAFAVYCIQRKVIASWEKLCLFLGPKITNLTRKVKKFKVYIL
jgi:hypothetical protein